MTMLSRRSLLKAALGPCLCQVCGASGIVARAAFADAPTRVHGPGYEMQFIGAQRETVANGKLAGILDLRTLADIPHLYGIGPIEQLRGEVTIIDSRPSLAYVEPDRSIRVRQTYEASVPFFVWASVPGWRKVTIPAEVQSFDQLEKFVPIAAYAAGLDPQKPFPFRLGGTQNLIEFHILNRTGTEPHNPERHRQIQVTYELLDAEARIVGFHSTLHRGIISPVASAIHMHFQSPDNRTSGHVQKLELGGNAVLEYPAP
jgi:acetolactate decarboxylase